MAPKKAGDSAFAKSVRLAKDWVQGFQEKADGENDVKKKGDGENARASVPCWEVWVWPESVVRAPACR
eukprot:7099319-Alexandrium_andersonii.AAC.1